MKRNNHQGKDTNTVLTNRSTYVTVVSSEPYCQRKFYRNGLPPLRRSEEEGRRRNIRGSRALHRTTLTFETSPVDRIMTSTMKESFSGRRGLLPSKQPKRSPSLHTSQFKVGIDSELDLKLKTTTTDSFVNHNKHPVIAHVDRARWNRQMAGTEMMNSTRHNGSTDIDFLTTYSKNHQFLSSKQEKWSCPSTGQWKSSIYNVVNGQQKMEHQNNFHLVSGNHILQNTRNEPLILN